MQLTLRTLIALRDNMLPPAEHEQLTRKLSDSNAGQLLSQKIERLLKEPQLVDQSHLKSAHQQYSEEGTSADLVAQYIDNIIDEEIIENFESSAVLSDQLLLEIAECHQILATLSVVPEAGKPLARNETRYLTSQIKKVLEEAPEANIFGCDFGSKIKNTETSQQNEESDIKDKSWIVRCENGQKIGPFNAVQLQQQINTQAVTLEDEVWAFGGNEWLAISELVESLALTFPSVFSHSLKNNKNRFRFIPASTLAASVSIAVLYFLLANGTPIPGQLVLASGNQLPKAQISLKFHPLFRPRGAHELPIAEEIDVNSIDGSFSVPAKISAGRIVRSGLHKVTIHVKGGGKSIQGLIPAAYGEKLSTPLQVTVEQAKQLKLVIQPQFEIAPPINQNLK